MKKVLIVLSSVRPNRVSDAVLEHVQAELKKRPDVEVSVADFRATPLPLFDGATATSAPNFEATDANVKAWTEAVAEADRLIILSAEYNHGYTAALKNAIDWLTPAVLESKPVSFVGYGFSGAAKAIDKTRALLTEWLKASPSPIEANLNFGKEIAMDGAVLDEEAMNAAINTVLDEIEA